MTARLSCVTALGWRKKIAALSLMDLNQLCTYCVTYLWNPDDQNLSSGKRLSLMTAGLPDRLNMKRIVAHIKALLCTVKVLSVICIDNPLLDQTCFRWEKTQYSNSYANFYSKIIRNFTFKLILLKLHLQYFAFATWFSCTAYFRVKALCTVICYISVSLLQSCPYASWSRAPKTAPFLKA